MSLIQEILRARANNVRHLDLSHRKLTELPEEIGYLNNTLESLNLSNNQLTTLPNSIGWLTKLKKLNLRNNKITAASFPFSTPVEITVLPTMERYVTVEVLPATVPATYKYWKLDTGIGLKGLTALEEFLLDTNVLADLPADITYLTALKELSLSRNSLTALTGIASLVALEKLYVSYNPFTALPAAINSCIALKHLAANRCKIATLPALGALVELQNLILDNNKITTFPAWISSLVEIRTINLSNNLIPTVPSGIVAPLTKIEKLYINGNPITNTIADIPTDLRVHDSLETVKFSRKGNPARLSR